MNHTIMIFDEEVAYARKLTEYINNKQGFPFLVKTGDDPDSLKDLLKRENIDIIIADEESKLPELGEKDIEKIILFKRNNRNFDHDRREIYKYQNCEKIIRELLGFAAETKGVDKILERKKELKITGFFTPVHRTGQTSLAMTLGEELSRHSKALYLNFESFAGMGRFFNDERDNDLSDLIYAVGAGNTELASYIAEISGQTGGMHMVPPMKSHVDLRSMNSEEWLNLIREIEKRTDYEHLILDLSEGIQGLFEILSLCDRIYMTVTNDMAAKAKTEQFMHELKILGYEDMEKKIYKCDVYDLVVKKSESAKTGGNDLHIYVKNLINKE